MTYVKYQVKDNAYGQLQTSASAAATSITLQSGHGARFPSFPGNDYICTLVQFDINGNVTQKERVQVTNRSGDVITITRGYDGDTALDFDANDYFYLYVTAVVIQDIQDELDRLETAKLNISDYQNGTKTYAATSTGTDAYAITLSPAPASYQTGMTFRFQADVANTGAATLNVNSLGAKTIKKLHDQDLASGDIEAGQMVMVSYDGTNFQMDSQIAAIPTVDINGQTEDTSGDIDADFVLEYDNSAGANRKIKPATWKASDAEALAGSATNKFITPAQLDKWFGYTVVTSSAPYTLQSADTARTKSVDTSWTKVKEIEIPVDGTYTIAFDLASGTVNAGEGRIYKNGSAVGTTRTLAASSGAYTTYTEDLAFAAGDLCQIYYRTSTTNPGCDVYVRNFRIKGVIVPNSFPAQATVNTD